MKRRWLKRIFVQTITNTNPHKLFIVLDDVHADVIDCLAFGVSVTKQVLTVTGELVALGGVKK